METFSTEKMEDITLPLKFDEWIHPKLQYLKPEIHFPFGPSFCGIYVRFREHTRNGGLVRMFVSRT